MVPHRQLRSFARAALARFDPTAEVGRRLSHGENTVYAVVDRPWILRLHRPDYHLTPALESELVLLEALGPTDFRVARAVPTGSGQTVVDAGDRRATVLTRLDGRLDPRLSASRARILGETLAGLHAWSRGWTPPPGFDRPRWDRAGLYGSRAVWSALEGAGVDPGLAADLRSWLDARLAVIDSEQIVVHHDLHHGNLVWAGASPGLIDWDDSGWGSPMVDVHIAMTRLPEALQHDLIRGYGGVPDAWEGLREPLELALLARAVGWLHSRRDIPRFVAYLVDFRARLVERARTCLEEA